MSDLKRELYTIEEKIKEIGAELQKNETKNSKIKYGINRIYSTNTLKNTLVQ